MKTFNDSTGKPWELDINVESIERVKTICNVELTQLFNDGFKLLYTLFEDTALLTAVLVVLCAPDDKPAFQRSMKGDCLEDAARALVDDVIDFFPNRNRRKLCKAAIAKLWETVEAGQELAEVKLSEFNPKSLTFVGSSVALSG